MPTPPTGLARAASVAAEGSPARARCPRCSVDNPAHMRFCNNCGYELRDEPQPSPDRSADAQGTICWRCYGAGDPGADFCKFCGARYADAPGAAAAAVSPAPAPVFRAPDPTVEPTVSPRRVAPTAAAGSPQTRGSLVSILKDGSDGRRFPVVDEQTDIGRTEGQVVLGDDPYLSPRHARLTFRNGQPVLRDLDSVNGIYFRIREPADIGDGDMLLLGQQVLRLELLSDTELPLGPAMQQGVMVFGTPEVQRIARLVQYTTEGVCRDVHYLYRDETVIGREQGDLVFTDDPFMSRRHAAITVDRASRRFVLNDLGSSNGTAVRFRGERVLRPGDQFRVGRHLFRFELGTGEGQRAR